MDRLKTNMVTQRKMLDDILWNLQWVGCNPEKTHTAYKLLFSYQCVAETIVLLLITTLFLEEASTLESFTSFVMYSTIVAQALGKMTLLYLNRNTLLKISKAIKELFWTADTFEEYKDQFQSNLTFANRVFRSYRSLITIIYIMHIIFPTLYHEMIFPAWLPFDRALLQTSLIYVLSVNILEILTVSLGGYFAVVYFDCLIGFLFVVVILQFKLLQKALQNIKNIESNSSKQAIIRCIRHHKVLLEFVEDLTILFKSPILLQISCALLAMCTSTYLVTDSSAGFNNTAKFFAYAFGNCFQMFMLCLAGQILQHESGLVSEAVYFSDWSESYDKNFWNSVQFITMRSNKECVLTIWLVKLDLQLFIQVIQLSFSMYTFLQNTK